MTAPRILIIGGSTRAAADSVRRAGWAPVCADFFADIDLHSIAQVIPVQNYPDSLPDDIAHVRADAWFYCGALENRPEVIERVLNHNSSIGPLLGSSPNGLRLVRDPFWLSILLRCNGISTLEVADASSPPVPDGSWLQKPLASAGGRLIRIWDSVAASDPFPERHYFQVRAQGIGMSVIFRFEGDEAEWLGVSEELATPALSHSPTSFSYCGSIGPIQEIPIRARATLTKIANLLARQATGLRGLVGLDFRMDGEDIWLTEVNPRYTASVEVLELATNRSFLNPLPGEIRGQNGLNRLLSVETSNRSISILRTARSDSISISGSRPNIIDSHHRVVIKQVLYAEKRLKVPDLKFLAKTEDPWEIPVLADIPHPGLWVEPGWPICTVMAWGTGRQSVEAKMANRVACIREALETF